MTGRNRPAKSLLAPVLILCILCALAACDAKNSAQPRGGYPRAEKGVALPGDKQVISRILIASCIDEERAEPTKVLQSIAGESADLLLMLGDNVYGDMHDRRTVKNPPDLDEMGESFADLARRADFAEVRAKHPMMVAWDDHDYGKNDAGREFAFKQQAERLHERFWGLDTQDVGQRPGTYYARVFGPAGKRVQVIMLDTRFFRSPLTPTDERLPGKERYIPSSEPDQDMLGAAQWQWLDQQLRTPADLRLIASSIQVLHTDAHGYESWSRLPAERSRLLALVRDTNANGVVFASGDRHYGFFYRQKIGGAFPTLEITASAVNYVLAPTTSERDSAQVGDGYANPNYGQIAIDWAAGRVTLTIKDDDGNPVREISERFR